MNFKRSRFFTILLLVPLFQSTLAENLVAMNSPARNPFLKQVRIVNIEHNSSALSLSQYSIDRLELCGILQEKNKSTAILRDPVGLLHQLRPGDTIGIEKAKITTISADEIELTTQGAGLEKSATTLILKISTS
jgi:Tfp pilus assembly protein PilP